MVDGEICSCSGDYGDNYSVSLSEAAVNLACGDLYPLSLLYLRTSALGWLLFAKKGLDHLWFSTGATRTFGVQLEVRTFC